MATDTYIPIATTTLGVASSTISFASIPSTYTDLILVLECLSANSSTPSLTFNGSAVGYGQTWLNGNGSAPSGSGVYGNTYLNLTPGTTMGMLSTVPSFYVVQIMSYTNSLNKSVLTELSEEHGASGSAEFGVGSWANTSVINSILVTANSGTFGIGTIATLWGI